MEDSRINPQIHGMPYEDRRETRVGMFFLTLFLGHELLGNWCPLPDSNRHGRCQPRDFESLVLVAAAYGQGSTSISARTNAPPAHRLPGQYL